MKQVLITGGSSGIGQKTAQLLSENGWFVYLLGRNQEKLQKTQQSLTGPSEIIAFDLSQSTQFAKLFEMLSKADLSAVVNNAGIYKQGAFSKTTDEDWFSQFSTNLFAAVRLTRWAWPQLQKNKGTIVNVSSTLGIRPIENTSAYSASKAAMNSWTQTLALEGGPLGIRAVAVCPGLVDTPIHGFHQDSSGQFTELRKRLDKMNPLRRMGEPGDIAEAVAFALSDKASWMTGSLLSVDGGISLTTRDP